MDFWGVLRKLTAFLKNVLGRKWTLLEKTSQLTVLRFSSLKKANIYVGKTEQANFRLRSHFNGEGSNWTRKYKPVKVEKLIPNCDAFDEDKYTKKVHG